MADNIALEQFRINMMNQSGAGGLETGAGIGGGGGAGHGEIQGFLSSIPMPSPEKMEKNVQTTFMKTLEGMTVAFSGFAGQVTPMNLGYLTPFTLPAPIASSASKIPSVISKKGR